MSERIVNTSFNNLSVEFIHDFLKKHATKEQRNRFMNDSHPTMYQVPKMENGVQVIIPAHISESGKHMKAKPAYKWTIPANEKEENEYIKKGFKAKKGQYSHLHAKNSFVEMMEEELKNNGYECLLPKESTIVRVKKSSIFDDLLDD